MQSLQGRRLIVPLLKRSWELTGVNASHSTVCRRLQQVGLECHQAIKQATTDQ
jgi:hypothetical protein